MASCTPNLDVGLLRHEGHFRVQSAFTAGLKRVPIGVSLTPCRYAYSLPNPPSAEVLTAARGVLQSILLLAANALVATGRGAEAGDLNGSPNVGRDEDEGKGQPCLDDTLPASPFSPAWLLALPPVVLGSLEIGLYNTSGTTAQAWGLEVCTAMCLGPTDRGMTANCAHIPWSSRSAQGARIATAMEREARESTDVAQLRDPDKPHPATQRR